MAEEMTAIRDKPSAMVRFTVPMPSVYDRFNLVSQFALAGDQERAIRELAQANIFPGDMLWKNFGITRYGRVVFYDYDEIEYMTDCNFRRIPPAPDFETEMSGEVWYAVARNDIFPEEFATFLLASPVLRQVFMKHHKDLLTPDFWQKAQQNIRDGHVEDFFPYPQELRFCNLPQEGAADNP